MVPDFVLSNILFIHYTRALIINRYLIVAQIFKK
jgi:hypothetical protein